MSYVFGNVKAFWGSVSQRLIHTESGLAVEGHTAVAVMVVQKVAEAPAADLEAQVAVTGGNSRCFGQRFDKRDNMSAPPRKDRLGCPWSCGRKGFAHSARVERPTRIVPNYSALRKRKQTIWIADAHRDDGKRFVVRAEEKLTAFVELEAAIRGYD
jgi:hypothetical protein